MLTSSKLAKSANLRSEKTLFETSFEMPVHIFGKDDSTPATTPLRAVSTIRFDAKRFGFLRHFLFQLCCQRHKLGSRMSP